MNDKNDNNRRIFSEYRSQRNIRAHKQASKALSREGIIVLRRVVAVIISGITIMKRAALGPIDLFKLSG